MDSQHQPTHPWRSAVDVVETTRDHALPSPAPLIADPELLARRFRVTVLGDVRVDVRTNLRQARFTDMDTDHYESGPIETGLGGTAINFARFSISHFEEVRVVAAIGTDAWTPRIHAAVARLGCGGHLHHVDRPNSPVIVVRDRAAEGCAAGTRLMVADSRSTHTSLDQTVVEAATEHILAADALALDTYALLSPSSAAGVRAAVELATAAAIPIAIDIVPHNIDAIVAWADMRDLVRRASMVIVEAPTLLRLLGRAVPDTFTADDAVELVAGLPADLAGPTHTWFIRFGEGMADETVAISPGHHHVHYRTGYAQTSDVTGYGYRIEAAEMKWWLTNLARATVAYPGVNLGRPLRRPVD